MPDVMVLDASRLHRTFGRQHDVAVDDVSLNVPAGQIACLLGPNGAGKTTTVKMCSTLLTPTSGTVRIAGIDALAQPGRARAHLGLVLGGDHGFYSRASGRDNLLFFADVARVKSSVRASRVEVALEAVALADRAGDRVSDYSHGMRQRLHIARALLSEPQLIVLDEPTNGLDPEIALEVRSLVRRLANEGTGVLLTTHYMAEAELLSDELSLLMHGRVIVKGSVRDIVAASGVTSASTFSVDVATEALAEQIESIPGVAAVERETRQGRTQLRVAWLAVPTTDALVATLQSAGLPVPADLVTRPATLEESYLALVSEHAAAAR